MAEKKKIFSESDFDKDKQLFTSQDFEKENDVPLGTDTKGAASHTPDSQTSSGKGLGKVVGGIIGVAAICLLGYGAYSYMNQTDEESTLLGTTITDGGSSDTGATTDGGNTDAEVATDGVNTDAGIATDGGNTNSDNGTIGNSGNEQNSQSMLSGTLEQKAKDVIRGNYGCGKVRKLKLGDQYSEIQNMVNEMYRNGLVK